MCLEDRLLEALYKTKGTVLLSDLADSIFITTNAALSIVHRIQASHPRFIVFSPEGSNASLSKNEAATDAVQAFLDGGGFTAINEKEFIKYYNKELKREKRRELLRKITAAQTWKRWLAGTSIVVAGGWGLASWTKYLKQQK